MVLSLCLLHTFAVKGFAPEGVVFAKVWLTEVLRPIGGYHHPQIGFTIFIVEGCSPVLGQGERFSKSVIELSVKGAINSFYL